MHVVRMKKLSTINTNNCVQFAVNKLFPINQTIVFVNAQENFSAKNNQVISIREPFYKISGIFKTYGTHFMVFATDETNLLDVIYKLTTSKLWHRCKSYIGKFLIICKNCKEDVFLKLWNADIVSIVLTNTNQHYPLHIFKSLPFKERLR